MFRIIWRIGEQISILEVHFHSVTSTNEICLERLEEKKHSSVLISSNSQTNGRGRNQNKWHSKEGNIYFSFGFIKDALSENLPIKTAVIVSDAIQDFFDIDIQLKWPNDLVYKNKKLVEF